MKFSAMNIAGLKEVSTDEILKAEKDAKEMIEIYHNRFKLSDEDIENLKWFEKVISRCDGELKARGEREYEEWEKLFI